MIGALEDGLMTTFEPSIVLPFRNRRRGAFRSQPGTSGSKYSRERRAHLAQLKSGAALDAHLEEVAMAFV
jgi:hypothetical protein